MSIQAENMNRGSLPPELDHYWPTRIEEDHFLFGEYVREDAHFYDPHEEHVFEMVDVRDHSLAFTLVPCAALSEGTDGFSQPSLATHHVDNVCDLAGALEAGDIVELKDGVVTNIESRSLLRSEPYTFEFAADTVDSDGFLESYDTANGPSISELCRVVSSQASGSDVPTIFGSPSLDTSTPATEEDSFARSVHLTGDPVDTEFFSVQPYSKWTFEDKTIRNWVESHFSPGDVILNACAGKTRLTPPPGGRIVRNDINEDREADLHVDVAELAAHLEEESFDLILSDPPWTLYQANLRYEGNHVYKDKNEEKGIYFPTHIDLNSLPFETPGPEEKEQLGHSRLAKENFDYLLKPDGCVLELTFHGTAMPSRLNYEMEERVVFNPVGEAKAVIGSVDRKEHQPELSEFF